MTEQDETTEVTAAAAAEKPNHDTEALGKWKRSNDD